MKKIFTLTISVISIFFSVQIHAQYSNASLDGPWLTHTDMNTYFLFDGNGNINEFGVFSGVTGSNVGTYSVASNGAISGYLSIFSMAFTGQLFAADTGSLDVPGVGTLPIYKVMQPGLLTDTLTGTLVDDTAAITKNVVFKLNANGQIIYASGLDGASGRIYSENGVFAGFISSTDNSMGSCWQKMMISGTYSGNVLSGTLKLDCTSEGGTVNLTRTGNSTTLGISKELSSFGFSIYPNPFTRSLTLAGYSTQASVRIYDINGKIVLDQEMESQNNSLEGLEILEPGVYMLQIVQNGKSESYKIVKE